MKSILFIVHYFYPDFASTGQIMTELCQSLQKDFRITVIAVGTKYSEDNKDLNSNPKRETYQNIDIIRVSAIKQNKKKKLSRLIHIISYFFSVIFEIIRQNKHDYVFAISQPPIIGGFLGVVAKLLKRSEFIYNIQDFNPEQAEAVGYTSKITAAIARRFDNISCCYADKLVLVGNDMLETLKKRKLNIDYGKVCIINNWIDEKEIYPLPKSHPGVREFINENDLQDKLIIQYSGNIGLYYDLENIVRLAGNFIEYKNLMFIFVGEGILKDSLINMCKEKGYSNIHFLPYQRKEELIYSLNAADIHLVTNKKGIKGISVPSKIYGCMATGKYILGILEEGSEAAGLIHKSKCGCVIEPGDYEAISDFIKAVALRDISSIESEGKNGRAYLERYLCRTDSINKYKELLQ